MTLFMPRHRQSIIAALLVLLASITGCDSNSSPLSNTVAPNQRSSSVTTPDLAWTSASLPLGISFIDHINCLDSFCVASGQDATARANILLSTDDGRGWKMVTRLADVNNLAGIACLDQGLCLALGRNLAREPIVVESVDDGITWIQKSMEIPGMDVASVACSESACIATGTSGGSPTTLGSPAVFYAPGGSDWSLMTNPDPNILTFTQTYCFVDFCWVGAEHEDGQSYVFQTSDGVAWNRSAPLAHNDGPLAIGCVDSGRCVVVGSLYAAATEDGGQSWLDIPLPSHFYSLSDVSCAAEQGCIIIANQGLVALDRGALRDQTLPAIAGNLRTISCAGGTCVASGSSAASGEGPPILVGSSRS
jgi:photosystem II stability/assembly factor-like uncharacterized protein